ncbi:MAG: EamA family transporter [Deltaproteobacteria bacterium]|jgi:drug/metabolite transporter (DMT)-like permease|nr:EamA family transporter [Deltaproteobacteria bacterium]
MTVTAILLIILSAFLHAGWNLVSKKEVPSISYFFLANLFGSALFLPMVFLHWQMYFFFPVQVWICAFISGAFLTMYFYSLAKTFQSGDLSIVYPIVRSAPIIIVPFFSFIIGTGHKISIQSLGGMILITVGCFLLPMTQIQKIQFRDYINITVGFALLAAIGTAGYNIADDQALTYLRANAHINLNNFELTTLYFFIEAMSSFLCLLVVILMTRRNRQDLLYKIRHKKKNTILLGVTIYTTYTLVLISMAYVNNVSYVVAFRQLSIPLGAIAGVLILKESCYRTKVIGICVLLIGLLLVSTG